MSLNSNTYNPKYTVFQYSISNNLTSGEFKLTIASDNEKGRYLIFAKSLAKYVGTSKRIQDWSTIKRCVEKLDLTNADCESPINATQFLKGQGRDFLPIEGGCIQTIKEELIRKSVATPEQMEALINLVEELPIIEVEADKAAVEGEVPVSAELDSELLELKNENSKLESDISELNSRLATSIHEHQSLIKQYTSATTHIKALNAEIYELKNQLKGIPVLEDQKSKLQGYKTQFESAVLQLQEAAKELEQYNQQITLLEESHKKELQQWENKFNAVHQRLQHWEQDAANPTIAKIQSIDDTVPATFIESEMIKPIANAKKGLAWMNMGLAGLMQFFTVPVNTLGLYSIVIFVVTFSRPSLEWTMFLNPLFWGIALFWIGMDVRRSWFSYQLGNSEAKLNGHKTHFEKHQRTLLSDFEVEQLEENIEDLNPKVTSAQQFNYMAAMVSAVICVLLGIGTFDGGDLKTFQADHKTAMLSASTVLSADSSRIQKDYKEALMLATVTKSNDSIRAATTYPKDTAKAFRLYQKEVEAQNQLLVQYTGSKEDYNYQILQRKVKTRLSELPKQYKEDLDKAEAKRDTLLSESARQYAWSLFSAKAQKDSLLKVAFANYQTAKTEADNLLQKNSEIVEAEVTVAGFGFGISKGRAKVVFYLLLSLVVFLFFINFIEEKINESWRDTGKHRAEGFIEFLKRNNLSTDRLRKLVR